MGRLIEKTLVLSTGHITEKDSGLLQETADNRKLGELYPYPHKTLDHGDGYILYVPPNFKIKRNSEQYIEELHKGIPQPAKDYNLLEDFSEAFKDLLILAQENGCEWINLDTGVDPDTDLTVFDW